MKNRLRILVGADVPPDPNSGAAGTVYHTNQALRELGYEVDEIWQDDLPHRISHGNLHYLLELPLGYRNAVRRRCREKDYDVIMLSQPHAWLAAMDHCRRNRRGVFINRSHGLEPRVDEAVRACRVQLDLHGKAFVKDCASKLMKRCLNWTWHPVVKFSDGFVVPCEDDRDHLVSHLGASPRRVRIIHHGIPREYERAPVKPLTQERLQRILHVGQHSFFKGQVYLPHILDEVMWSHPQTTFTWVCSKKDHNEALSMFDPKLHSRIRMLDWMSQGELRDVYDTHGIFLFPTLAEGAGKSCLEAMSRGMCVVASDNSGMKDYINSGQNGLLAPVGDASAFARGTARFLSQTELARRCSVQAVRFGQSRSWKRTAKGIEEFYQTLLERQKRH